MFDYSACNWHPVRLTELEFHRDIWYWKTRLLSVPGDENVWWHISPFQHRYRSVNRQTDGRRDKVHTGLQLRHATMLTQPTQCRGYCWQCRQTSYAARQQHTALLTRRHGIFLMSGRLQRWQRHDAVSQAWRNNSLPQSGRRTHSRPWWTSG